MRRRALNSEWVESTAEKGELIMTVVGALRRFHCLSVKLTLRRFKVMPLLPMLHVLMAKRMITGWKALNMFDGRLRLSSSCVILRLLRVQIGVTSVGLIQLQDCLSMNMNIPS